MVDISDHAALPRGFGTAGVNAPLTEPLPSPRKWPDRPQRSNRAAGQDPRKPYPDYFKPASFADGAGHQHDGEQEVLLEQVYCVHVQRDLISMGTGNCTKNNLVLAIFILLTTGY